MKDEQLYFHLKKSVDLSKLPEVKGPDFEKEMALSDFIKSYSGLGFQATELARAIDIVKLMRKEKATIYLSYSGNMISSGLREIIKYLVKNNYVDVLITTAAGIDEDAIKSLMPFRMGDFHVPGKMMFEAGIGRIGNVYSVNEHYTKYEFFLRTVFNDAYDLQKERGYPVTPSELAVSIGKHLENTQDCDYESSVLYWAYKNNIPVYCPGILDGSFGDMAYFFKQQHKDFAVDPLLDHKKLVDFTLNQEKTAGILLGGGISKHYTLNAQIFREGFDFAVYLSTAQFFDGSDSGGNQEEAISWAKIKPEAPRVKVYADATLTFPMIVYAAFVDYKVDQEK